MEVLGSNYNHSVYSRKQWEQTRWSKPVSMARTVIKGLQEKEKSHVGAGTMGTHEAQTGKQSRRE